MKRKLLSMVFGAISLLVVAQPLVSADSGYTQQDLYKLGINYFDISAGSTSCSSAISSGGIGTGGFSLNEVKTFASEPVTSTWNISDSNVEKWFLKTNTQVIARYKLSSSNIGSVTSAVRANGVSPALFYLYTVNEGGTTDGSNLGFINHTDRSGLSAVQAATDDAQYIAAMSKQTGGHPATGGGEPNDMPTAEAQQILSALPAGSIGVVYIQATAAVTAELEDLSGKTGSWSGLFGMPLSAAMQNIKAMGGDPQQGGATLSTDGCTAGVTGEGMTKGINFGIAIANNDGYGYDQDARESGWQKWQSDPSCTNQCGSFDCSSFVSAILTVAGYFTTNPNFATSSEDSVLISAGFKKVATSAPTSDNLLPGDVLLGDGHTALYIGNGQLVQARINELGTVSGGQVGDQTGREIVQQAFYDFPWIGIYRAQN